MLVLLDYRRTRWSLLVTFGDSRYGSLDGVVGRVQRRGQHGVREPGQFQRRVLPDAAQDLDDGGELGFGRRVLVTMVVVVTVVVPEQTPVGGAAHVREFVQTSGQVGQEYGAGSCSYPTTVVDPGPSSVPGRVVVASGCVGCDPPPERTPLVDDPLVPVRLHAVHSDTDENTLPNITTIPPFTIATDGTNNIAAKAAAATEWKRNAATALRFFLCRVVPVEHAGELVVTRVA